MNIQQQKRNSSFSARGSLAAKIHLLLLYLNAFAGAQTDLNSPNLLETQAFIMYNVLCSDPGGDSQFAGSTFQPSYDLTISTAVALNEGGSNANGATYDCLKIYFEQPQDIGSVYLAFATTTSNRSQVPEYSVKTLDGDYCDNAGQSSETHRAYTDSVINCNFQQVNTIIIEDLPSQPYWLSLKQIMFFKEPDMGPKVTEITIEGLQSPNVPNPADQQMILFGESRNDVVENQVKFFWVSSASRFIKITLDTQYNVELLGIPVKDDTAVPFQATFVGDPGELSYGKFNWYVYQAYTNEITIQITSGGSAKLRKIIILGKLPSNQPTYNLNLDSCLLTVHDYYQRVIRAGSKYGSSIADGTVDVLRFVSQGACPSTYSIFDDIEGTVQTDPTSSRIQYDISTEQVHCEGLTTTTSAGASEVSIYLGQEGRTFPMTCTYQDDCVLSRMNAIEVPTEYQDSSGRYQFSFLNRLEEEHYPIHVNLSNEVSQLEQDDSHCGGYYVDSFDYDCYRVRKSQWEQTWIIQAQGVIQDGDQLFIKITEMDDYYDSLGTKAAYCDITITVCLAYSSECQEFELYAEKKEPCQLNGMNLVDSSDASIDDVTVSMGEVVTQELQPFKPLFYDLYPDLCGDRYHEIASAWNYPFITVVDNGDSVSLTVAPETPRDSDYFGTHQIIYWAGLWDYWWTYEEHLFFVTILSTSWLILTNIKYSSNNFSPITAQLEQRNALTPELSNQNYYNDNQRK